MTLNWVFVYGNKLNYFCMCIIQVSVDIKNNEVVLFILIKSNNLKLYRPSIFLLFAICNIVILQHEKKKNMISIFVHKLLE